MTPRKPVAREARRSANRARGRVVHAEGACVSSYHAGASEPQGDCSSGCSQGAEGHDIERHAVRAQEVEVATSERRSGRVGRQRRGGPLE